MAAHGDSDGFAIRTATSLTVFTEVDLLDVGVSGSYTCVHRVDRGHSRDGTRKAPRQNTFVPYRASPLWLALPDSFDGRYHARRGHPEHLAEAEHRLERGLAQPPLQLRDVVR